jgi:hypothetical protein
VEIVLAVILVSGSYLSLSSSSAAADADAPTTAAATADAAANDSSMILTAGLLRSLAASIFKFFYSQVMTRFSVTTYLTFIS